ncbi:MAG TPA: hypothetical protein VKK06_12285, partial [Terriglobia bacterium]|nr:hypothetical protein [Terriglobia bacterium]
MPGEIVVTENAIGLGILEVASLRCYRLPAVLNLILMMLNSLLVGLRSQAAMQAEIIALRHQVIVLQRSQKSRRPVLTR